MKIKLLLGYDGTDYCGWQRQADHRHGPEKTSIQETVETALSRLHGDSIITSASGRTDAGVHAIGQVIHWKAAKLQAKDLCWALHSLLPPSIVAKKAWIVDDEFHATLSAVRKTYRYWIWNEPRTSPLLHRYSWWIRKPLDLEYLNAMSKFLIGVQDFASFRSVGTPVKHTVRRIERAEWRRLNHGLIEFRVTGNGFLKQMVRNIVGTHIESYLKAKPVGMMEEILRAKDRRVAGATAPAQGLFLCRVEYPQHLDKTSRPI